MGNVSQHQWKAEHNLAFLESIPNEYPDWLATVAFYAAVDLIEVLGAFRGQHSKNHEDRKTFVKRNCRKIFHAYHTLYNAALDARYEPQERWLSTEEVRAELIGKRLKHIQKYVASHSKPHKAS